MASSEQDPVVRLAAWHLRGLGMTWAAAAALPVPLVLMAAPAPDAQIACLYLGLASAWLSIEIFRFGGAPQSRIAWGAKTLAIAFAVGCNAAEFIALGLAVSIN